MPRTSKLSITFRLALAIVVGLGGLAFSTGSAGADPSHEERLPATATTSPSVPNFGTTTKADGTPIGVVVSGGAGGMLNVIDLNQQTATSRPLTETDIQVQPWAYARLADRSILIGADKDFFQFFPDKEPKDQVVKLSDPSQPGFAEINKNPNERISQYWDMVVDDNGTAYVAGFHSKSEAKIFTYRADQGWGVLPAGNPLADGNNTVRSLAYENGKLYAASTQAIYEINLADGTKRELDLSQPTNGNPWITVHGGVLYYPTSGGMAVQNLTSGKTDLIPGVNGRIVKRPGENTKVNYVLGGVFEYDPTTGEKSLLYRDGKMAHRLSPLSWVTNDLLLATEMVGGWTSTVKISEGKASTRQDLVTSSPRKFNSLIAASDGKLYGDWFMVSPHLVQITPAADVAKTTSQLINAPNGQSEGMATHGDQLVTGLYEHARVGYHQLSDLNNPVESGPIHQSQSRPYALTHTAGDQYAVGTVPASGLGGALSFVNAKQGEIQATYLFSQLKFPDGSNPVARQSPMSLAYRDGKVYVGTTIRGAVGQAPADKEAYLLEIDAKTGTVIRAINPFPGEGHAAVNALTFSDDGQLYGTTGHKIFKVDLGSFKVAASTELSKANWQANRNQLIFHKGYLYTTSGGSLFAVPADLASSQSIAQPGDADDPDLAIVSCLTLGKDGYLYYARGAELYRHNHPTTVS